MLTEQHKALAKEIGELCGSVSNLLPGQTEADSQEFIEIVTASMKETAAKQSDAPVKDVVENVVDTLERIGDVVPVNPDSKKDKHRRRYINAVKIIKGFLHLFRLD